MYIHHAHRGQNRASYTLGLELGVVVTTVWAGVGLVLGPGEEDTEGWLGLLGHTVALYAVIPRRKVEGGALLRKALGAGPSASAHIVFLRGRHLGREMEGMQKLELVLHHVFSQGWVVLP